MKVAVVTACSVGIAHTYMAAEALEKAGKKMNLDIWVESQGSVGIEDQVPEEFIAEADFIIIASDMGIDKPERFEDKIIYESLPSESIKHPKVVIEKAIAYYEEKSKKK